jgi:hypothetical protein
MKRLRSRLCTLFWFLSLLLSIAFLVIWVISRRITTPATPSTFAVQTALSKKIPRVSFSGLQFRDGLEFLSDETGIQFELDAEAIDPLDYDGTKNSVNLQATNITAGAALNKMQASLSPRIKYWTDGSKIRISVEGTPWHANRAKRHPPDDVFHAIQKQSGGTQPASGSDPLWEGMVGSDRYTLLAVHGGLRLWITPPDPAAIYQQGVPTGSETDPMGVKAFDFAGLSMRRSASPFDNKIITVPFWLFIAITAIPPLLALRTKLRERRYRKLARCPSCGYDLRASPDRCPECGRDSSRLIPTASAHPPA